MTLKLAVVMDPIQLISPQKDTTLAMLLEAQSRGWHISYCQSHDLLLCDNKPHAYMRGLSVKDDLMNWYILGEEKLEELSHYDVILMRKDPPFNMSFIYATYLLQLTEQTGTLIVNNPQSLRDTNEKLATALFPECCPPSLVSCRQSAIIDFLHKHQDIVIKPLDGMGGASIFRLRLGDLNTNVAIETLTQHGKQLIMVQRYIPEISAGDKRVLLIDGEPVPYALARIPKGDDIRGNLARGASAEGLELSERDHWICSQVGPTLKNRGLMFVGLDIIGDYLTEVNVTSPTCVRELDKLYQLNICAQLFDKIETKLSSLRKQA